MSPGEAVSYAVTFAVGVGGGGVAGWFGRPAAHAKADERKLRRLERRRLIDEARAAELQSYNEAWQPAQLRDDPRFIAIARHLPKDATEQYTGTDENTIYIIEGGPVRDWKLVDAIDRLAKQWRLP